MKNVSDQDKLNYIKRKAIYWIQEYRALVEADYDVDDHLEEVPVPYHWSESDIKEIEELVK